MTLKIRHAHIDWTLDQTPRSREFDDVYFSVDGGLEESRHVFLNGNALSERWRHWHGGEFTVVELGFGTGLNFLLCWQLWEQTAEASSRLYYFALEKHPLDGPSLQRALQRWPDLSGYCDALLARYPDQGAGIHRLQLTPSVCLDIGFGDACQGLEQWQPAPGTRVDCWFLDGFAPSRNPDMWTPPLFRHMARLSGRQTTLSTYSVAGAVRRNLTQAGFQVVKRAGFASKREMLVASYNPDSASAIGGENQLGDVSESAWFKRPHSVSSGRSVVIVGAGLAGCASACFLARRGWRVHVVEQAECAADGASGNPQAILHCRLARNSIAATQFHLTAYLQANRHYQTLQYQSDIGWQACGVLQLETQTADTGKAYSDFYDPGVLQWCSSDLASRYAGLTLQTSAWWMPHGGWLEPRRLCQTYLDLPGIEFLSQTCIAAIRHTGTHWELITARQTLLEADAVILANSLGAIQFSQTSEFPLSAVRGQVSLLTASADSRNLKTVVAGSRTICPAWQEAHTVGSTYQPGRWDGDNAAEDDRENRQGIRECLESLDFDAMPLTGSRAALRCTTPDQLPVIGPVPNWQAMEERYGELRRNARAKIAHVPIYHPDLYINVGHGSYGLATCPLAGEYLAALLDGQALPLERRLSDVVHPSRFLIRKLKRQE